MMSDKTKISSAACLILPLLTVGVLSCVDASSIFSYLYTLVLFLVVNKIFCKGEKHNFLYFHYYLAFAIGLYLFHSLTIPNSLGSTGGVAGLGTDDYNYFSRLIYHEEVRYNYTIFLRGLYPFEIDTILNVIIVNLLGVSFLPYFVYRLSFKILASIVIAKRAMYLTLFCPFVIYYGCILMRDMWIATAVFAGLYYWYSKRYVPFLLSSSLVCFIRFGSLVFIGMGVLVLMRERIYAICKTRTNGRMLLLFMLVIAVGIFAALFPYLQEYSGGKLEDGLLRTSFYTKLHSMDSDAFILQLIDLPAPLNYMTLTAFFFFLPFWSVSFYNLGYFNMMRLFCTFLTPIFFFFLWKYVMQTILQNLNLKQNLPIKTFVYMALAYALSLGTVSLQSRHKTVLMPLLCILAAYGMHNPNRRYDKLASFITFIIIAVQAYMAL